MPSVEFSQDNLMKCICGQCPTQKESSCAAQKRTALMEAMQGGMQAMPAAADVAGMYCSTGTATCGDLDYSQNCICSGCAVFAENGLTQWKYCERGDAVAIG